MGNFEKIQIKTTIKSSVEKVWKYYTSPEDIVKWNAASEDWHTTRAENNLYPGGQFLSRMEAKDGSFGFDFFGIYDEVVENERIVYTLGDGRSVTLNFSENEANTQIEITFDAEKENSIELQKNGWQAILDNFKAYVESK